MVKVVFTMSKENEGNFTNITLEHFVVDNKMAYIFKNSILEKYCGIKIKYIRKSLLHLLIVFLPRLQDSSEV